MSGELTRLLDATWPAEECWRVGPFTLRRSDGGGKRVSAATACGAVTEADIEAAERAMDDCGQQAMFSVRADQMQLEQLLVDRTYLMLDPTRLFRIGLAELADLDAGGHDCTADWPPDDDRIAIWEAGHIGAARRAIMERAEAPKTAILARAQGIPVGATFVAVHEGIAIVRALEVVKPHRRRGAARDMLIAAAAWARGRGADRLVALAVDGNVGAGRLFETSGFAATDAYHYRIRP